MSDPLPIGAVMKDPGGDHWRVEAVMQTGGERYYMMSLTPDDVSMMPAFVVEQWQRATLGEGAGHADQA